MLWQQGEEKMTATLPPQRKCSCLEPIPGPPAGGGVEQRGSVRSRPGARVLSTNFSPTGPGSTEMLGVKRNNHYFFFFIW